MYATLNVSTARLFRMLGVEIHIENALPCKLENCRNYVIKTGLAAFERFYHRVPDRDTAIIRSLSPSQMMKNVGAGLGKYPLMLENPEEASLALDDL